MRYSIVPAAPSGASNSRGVDRVIITMTGASGFIGRRLLKNFTAAGHEVRVLSRHAGTNLPGGIKLFAWDPLTGPPPSESLLGSDAVVHLAGEPVAQRWN